VGEKLLSHGGRFKDQLIASNENIDIPNWVLINMAVKELRADTNGCPRIEATRRGKKRQSLQVINEVIWVQGEPKRAVGLKINLDSGINNWLVPAKVKREIVDGLIGLGAAIASSESRGEKLATSFEISRYIAR
jgi:hypothetical protein